MGKSWLSCQLTLSSFFSATNFQPSLLPCMGPELISTAPGPGQGHPDSTARGSWGEREPRFSFSYCCVFVGERGGQKGFLAQQRPPFPLPLVKFRFSWTDLEPRSGETWIPT